MKEWVSKVLDRLSVVVGALVLSQAPLFIQQYRDQLIGHVQELQLQIEAMQRIAQGSQKTLGQWIEKFTSNPDVDIMQQGTLMQQMVSRGEALSSALTALDGSSFFSKPWKFLFHLDYSIFKSTLASFKMGLLLTFEGLCYALIGMGMGYLIYLGIKKCISSIASTLHFPAVK